MYIQVRSVSFQTYDAIMSLLLLNSSVCYRLVSSKHVIFTCLRDWIVIV